MPERGPQFDYPEKDWAVGKMAKAGPRGMDPGREYRELEGQRKRKEAQVSQNGGYPTLSKEEWEGWLNGPVEQPRLRYGKEHRLDNAIQDHPEGFLVDRDHPRLKDLEGDVDIFNLPGEGEGGPYFARPRKAPQGMVEDQDQMVMHGRVA